MISAMFEDWKDCKIKELQDYKITKLENWKIGKLENWKNIQTWKINGLG